MKYYTAFTTNWPRFQAVHPLKVAFHCREFTLSRYRSVGSMVRAELVIIMFTTALESSAGLRWTSELEAGGYGAVAVCLTFSCTLRLSITPALQWVTGWTDCTLWFYGKRMWTLSGLFYPFLFLTGLSWVRHSLEHVFFISLNSFALWELPLRETLVIDY